MKQCCQYVDSLPADAVAIPDYPNNYATPCGKIYSRFGRLKLRRFSRNSVGYPICRMRNAAGEVKFPLVHRIIAWIFVAGDKSLTVNHIDMDKTNCAASNLEWVTFKDNHIKGRAMKPEWGKDGGASKALIASDPASHEDFTFKSGKEAAIWVGNANASGNISKATVHGRLAYGFYWRKA